MQFGLHKFTSLSNRKGIPRRANEIISLALGEMVPLPVGRFRNATSSRCKILLTATEGFISWYSRCEGQRHPRYEKERAAGFNRGYVKLP